MAEIIFEDGAKIEFANGRFDKWCVYYTNKDGERFPPHDIDYFDGLDGFIDTKIRDTIKTIYCKENNIKLIRIPYWNFNNIEEILERILKFFLSILK